MMRKLNLKASRSFKLGQLGIRELAVRGTAGIALLFVALPPDALASESSVIQPQRTVEFTVDEGTWINLDVSPDGETIIFDLLGDLYALPTEGGAAKPMTQGLAWNTAPRYSPNGREIWFISDRDLRLRDLWALPISGGSPRKVAPADDRDIVGYSWVFGTNDIVIEKKGSAKPGSSLLRILKGNRDASLDDDPATDRATGIAADSENGIILLEQPTALQSDLGITRFDIFSYDVKRREKRLLIPNGFAPKPSRDGKSVAFFRANGVMADLWVYDRTAGKERLVAKNLQRPRLSDRTGWHMQTSQGIVPSFAFGADDRSLYMSSNGKIVKVDLSTGASEIVPFVAKVFKQLAEPVKPSFKLGTEFEAKQLRWFNVAKKGRIATFSAGGAIWRADLRSRHAHPVLVDGGRNFSPSISPDSTAIAFVDQSTEVARLKLIPSTGGISRILGSNSGPLTQPAWSPDGKSLAYWQINSSTCAEERPASETSCAFLSADAAVWNTELIEVGVGGQNKQLISSDIIPKSSVEHRLAHATLSYSEDGRSIFFSEFVAAAQQNLRISSVDRFTGRRTILAEFSNASNIDFAIPSPDGRLIVMAANDQMWVYRVSKLADHSTPVNFEGDQSKFQSVGIAGTNASWSRASTLQWSVGNHVFRWRPGLPVGLETQVINATLPVASPRGRLAVINATIVPMDFDRVIENGTILIEGARIVAVGTNAEVKVPAETSIIDAAGKTVVPGFVDTHAHPHNSTCCEWETPKKSYKPYQAALAWGVTTIFDPQADEQTSAFSMAELIGAGAMVGPRVFSSGTAIFGDGANYPNPSIERGGAKMLCPVVRQRALNGAIFIKSYLFRRRDWRQALVECARTEGIGITTEGGGDTNAQLTHYLDGHTATEHHLLGPVLYDDVVQFLARSQIFYTPITTHLMGGQEAVRYFGTRGAIYEDSRIRSFLPDGFSNYVKVGGYTPDNLQPIYEIARSAQRIAAAGGKIAVGSHGQFDGIGLHHDMWALQLGGLSPFEILKAATLSGAEKLGLDHDLGSIEVGKLADLAVLDCNPLGDIRCSAKTRYVIKSGFAYRSETLEQIYPSAAVGYREGNVTTRP